MPVFMVERDLKGITMDQLAGAQKSATQTGRVEALDLRP